MKTHRKVLEEHTVNCGYFGKGTGIWWLKSGGLLLPLYFVHGFKETVLMYYWYHLSVLYK